MNRTVIISKMAQKSLERLFDYLIENWSISVKNKFVKKLDYSISIIRNNPESFPESKKESGLRKCVITKQITLFYHFTSEQIHVVAIFDTRQHPYF